jgi:anti-sigma B factor antagonist
MQIEEEGIANTLILTPSGRIDGLTAGEFERALLARIDGKPARVLLDLGGVDYISSAGLRAILVGAKRAKAVGCALEACGLRASVREVFNLSGFGTVVAVHATRDEALRT